ncbi:MAG: LOG family protein [Parcubacteria group bacterium]|nr:LOG family protein [Parcubacteria group bacterium]
MQPKKVIIGVMGSGKEASSFDIGRAFALGKLIADNGWVLLSGGIGDGVMDAASQGAKAAGGLTIGIIPRLTSTVSKWVDIPIMTDMGSGRNNINALSSTVLVACGIRGAGTASEVALALKAGKHVVLLCCSQEANAFFGMLGQERTHVAENPREAELIIREIVTQLQR